MSDHQTLLTDLFSYIDKNTINKILDAGSGKTSLTSLINEYHSASIDAIVYYNDNRKINSIKENVKSNNYNLIEKDIVNDSINDNYDLVLAHLLLGEAQKFGNSFESLLSKLLEIKTKYLIIIDIKEDPAIDYCYLENMLNEKYKIIAKSEIRKSIPQEYDNFVAQHYIGYVIEK